MYLREHTEPVTVLPGIGPAGARALSRMGIETLRDLLLCYPRDYEDRSRVIGLREVGALLRNAPLPRKTAAAGETIPAPACSVLVTVRGHEWFGHPRRKTLKIVVTDETAHGVLLCFNRPFLAKSMPEGERFFVSGRWTFRGAEIQSTSFEYESYSPQPRDFLRILPVYPLTEGLTQAVFRRAVTAGLGRVGDIDDELPRGLRTGLEIPSKIDALREAHQPSTMERAAAARRYLAFEELFYFQITLLRAMPREAGSERRRGRRTSSRSTLQEALLDRLPFTLTPGQLGVLAQIDADLRDPVPSVRLVQGDVGCGKTLVGLLAGLQVMESGEQVAFMAPTELLAGQHAENALRLLGPLGIRVGLLTAGISPRRRAMLLEALRSREEGSAGVDLLVGTHALFSEDVEFARLGLVVIDEQQRFGVDQRRRIVAKGSDADVLLMTATPIPRTLALTVFGDLEVSEIRTMPEGRRPVKTHLAREGKEGKVYDAVRAELERGHQAYFVYPLIEESEDLGLKDAQTMFAVLRDRVFPQHSCALIHSRLPEEEKASSMAAFARGEVRVLAATSVVEVGVDVKNATCMVIEHAERFGLSQLHQLRGRVGRSTEQSYAFLVYSRDLTEAGTRRLRVMMETTDGFRIAEEDLRLRGPGALVGVRQSGFLRFSIADITRDADLLSRARGAAREILEGDPGLLEPEHGTIREVLERASPFAPAVFGAG